ncbi:MAG: hypothetical protein RL660_834 [Bacteroidota bacterium]|jgi:putative ATPase
MTQTNEPLSSRARPTTLQDIVGQAHLVAEGAPLHRLLSNGELVSMILWGPPGVGKTTIAKVLASSAGKSFVHLSAIDSNVKEVRAAIDRASIEGQIVLFLDEIHRFNKAQQDSLLRAVEEGKIILIGATTENPSFEVINALLSRCQVYVLHSVSNDALLELLQRVISTDSILQQYNFDIKETEALLQYSGGDARKMLNIIELLVQSSADKHVLIANTHVASILQKNIAQFDKGGDWHYDVISAFIKSMRGSDPNAAVYWLARMIAGGEDPLFIARRMVIFASEDIGNANPNALLLANECYNAVHHIGYPEARIVLSQVVIYLACSVKSNSAYLAIDDALALVNKTGNLPVPLHLRNAPTQLMKAEGYGKAYIYPHNEPGNFVEQQYMPSELLGTRLYQPGQNTAEAATLARLQQLWKEIYKP